MNTDRWKQAEELFAAALEREPGQREAFLQAACADDPALRAEVESLLAAHAQADDFIETPAAAFAADLLPEEPAANEGKFCGSYRLIHEIGHGGMGEVYLAVRDDDQYQKQVAIKLVRRGMDIDLIIRRFRQERQILASLDHPNIARLLDGGTTEDGLPWLAMEYIEGEPIDVYCDRRRLSIVERLKLFRTVCAAAHYAHQNLVIHRDLKPSNILVTADGAPKLLDFGIAKILNSELHERTADQTLSVMRLMTPSYASPEQIKGETITTASDVYSLGVVLYELLTGHRPYHITGHLPHEMTRIVCEEAPTRPSLAVARLGKAPDGKARATITPEEASHARNDQPKRLQRQLAGDLDDIALTALRKEPERRYSSVEQFSEDIRRHLEGLPVTASRDTFAYRGAKFVRRNKAAVAFASLAVLLLLIVAVVAVWQARVATRQATIAQREGDKARRINEFLRATLSYANPLYNKPGHGKGSDVKLVDAIRDAGERIDAELKEEPEVRAELHYTLGQVWWQRGEYGSAEPHARAALELFRQLHGERHPRFIQSLYTLGYIERIKGDNAASIKMMGQAIEMMRLNDPQNSMLPFMIRELGENLVDEGRFPEAEALILESMDALRKMVGTEDHMWVAYSFCRLGNLYKAKGEMERAQAAYLEYLERLRRLPIKHEAGEALYNLGVIEYARGNYEEAEKRLNEAEELFSRYLGPSYPQIAQFLYYLSSIHCLQGDYARAEAEARRALEIRRQKYGPDHPSTIISLGLLGKTLISAGRPARAAPYLREAMEKYRATPNRNKRFQLAGILGECLTLLKRYDEAERLLNESYAIHQCDCSGKSPEMVEMCQRLVKLYEAWGKPEQGARYRS